MVILQHIKSFLKWQFLTSVIVPWLLKLRFCSKFFNFLICDYIRNLKNVILAHFSQFHDDNTGGWVNKSQSLFKSNLSDDVSVLDQSLNLHMLLHTWTGLLKSWTACVVSRPHKQTPFNTSWSDSIWTELSIPLCATVPSHFIFHTSVFLTHLFLPDTAKWKRASDYFIKENSSASGSEASAFDPSLSVLRLKEVLVACKSGYVMMWDGYGPVLDSKIR